MKQRISQTHPSDPLRPKAAAPPGRVGRTARSVLRLGLLAAVLYYTGRTVVQRFATADWQGVQLHGWPMVAAGLLLMVGGGLTVISYRCLVRGFWPHVPGWRKMASIAWLPEIGKYLPGRVANIAASLWLFGRQGIPAPAVVGVLFVLNGLAVLSGLLLSVPLTLWRPVSERVPGAWVGCLVVMGAGLACLHPAVFRKASGVVLRLMRRPGLEMMPRAGDYVVPFVLMMTGRSLAGVSLWLIARSVVGVAASKIPLFVGGLALASTSGYMAFFAPAGIGVREGVLLIVLTPAVGDVPAAVVALAARLVQTIVEIVLAGIGLLLLRAEGLQGDRGEAIPGELALGTQQRTQRTMSL